MLRRSLLAALLLFAGPAALAQESVSVDGAFARPTIGQQRSSAAYMTIRSAAGGDRLLRVTSPIAARAEMHNHIKDGDVMRMREVPSIEVPAGGTATLAPGGLHIMLLDLTQPLKTGESIPLTLEFEKAGRIEITASIRTGHGAASPHKH